MTAFDERRGKSIPKDSPSVRALAEFKGAGYVKGRPVFVQAAWFITLNVIFTKWWLPPSWRPTLLRAFGARIGHGVFIRHRVRILWPWKLRVGDDTWIGEGAWILNLENVTIGSNVCLSQDVSLITGSHNRRSPTFEYDNGPIKIDDGAWIAYGATVLRGVHIGAGATVGARSLTWQDVATNRMSLK